MAKKATRAAKRSAPKARGRAAPKTPVKTTPKSATAKARGGRPKGSPKRVKSLKRVQTQSLSCEINHADDNDLAELTWKLDGKPLAGGSFTVERQRMRDQAAAIREALQRLEQVTPTYKKAPQAYADPLRKLAHAGAGFAKIVIGAVGSDKTKAAAAPFRKWFQDKVVNAPAGSFEIVVTYLNLDTVQGGVNFETEEDTPTRTFVAPWHLAFSPAADVDIDDLPPTSEAYAGFWCARFRLAVVTAGQKRDQERYDPALGAAETTIAAALEIDAQRTKGIRQDVLLQTADQLVKHRIAHGNNHRFYYVRLRDSGGSYMLGGQHIDNYVLDESQHSDRGDRVVITMFDGDCIMRDRPSWIEPLMMRLRGGLIAPETDVKNSDEPTFGWEFMKATIGHAKALGEAIDDARLRFWPRSLLYGFYCNARNVYINPPHEMADFFKDIDDFIAHAGT